MRWRFTMNSLACLSGAMWLLVDISIGSGQTQSQPQKRVLSSPSTAQGKNSPSDYTPEMLQKLFKKEALEYEFEIAKTKEKLELRDEPLLNWQNPERLLEQGSFFVWMDGTRPSVVGSVFTYQYQDQLYRRHELISLSPEALIANVVGKSVWVPNKADCKGFVVSEESEPAATAPRRLTQMRSIMRDVSGRHLPPESKPNELRLLPQPLLRYQSEKDGIIDGAIFSLAVGTDPEILVVLEARKEADKNVWRLVAFRSHYEGLEMSYKGSKLWSAVAIPEFASTGPMQMPFAKQPFFVYTPVLALPPADVLK